MSAIGGYIESLFDGIRKPEREVEDMKREIEEHLLESVHDLLSEGYSEREAVRIALERFGDPRRFNREFSKILASRSRRRKEWRRRGWRRSVFIPAAAAVIAAVLTFITLGTVAVVRDNASATLAERILRLEAGAEYHNGSLLTLADIAATARHNAETIYHIAELVREFKYHTVPLVNVASLAARSDSECRYYREIAELVVMKLSETRRVEALAEAAAKARNGDDFRALEERIVAAKAGADFKTLEQAAAYNRRL